MKQILQKLCLLTSFGMLSVTNVWADEVIKIGDKPYSTLEEAFSDAKDDDIVELLADYDATGEEWYAVNTNRFIGFDKSLTIDGNNHTLTVKGRGIAIGQYANTSLNVTFKDINIINSTAAARCIDTRGHIGTLTLDNVTLNTQGCPSGYNQTLTIGGYQASNANINIINHSVIQTNDKAKAYYAIVTFNPVNLTISESTIYGWAALYMKGKDSSAGSENSTVTINNSTIKSLNVYNGTSNAFGAIKFEDNNINVTITNSNIIVDATGNQPQGIVCDDFQRSGNTVTLGEGNIVTLNGNASLAGNARFTVNAPNTLSITGGTFNTDPSYFVADGYGAVKVADNVWKVTTTTVTNQADAGDENTTESYTIFGDDAAVTTVNTEEGATSVTIPAEVNNVAVTSIAENAFENVENKDEIKSIDLSATSITGVEVNRSEGVFADFPEETLIYMPAGNTAADGQKNVIINDGTKLVCNDFLLTDTKSYDIPKAFTVTNATLERSFTENIACTICLPFALNTTGIDGTFAYFDEIDGTTIYMTAVAENSTLTAYQPYIFLPSATFNNMQNTNITATIDMSKTANKEKHEDFGTQCFTFTGTLEYKKFTDHEIQDGVYGFAAKEAVDAHIGDFVKGSAGCYIQGLRAYLISDCDIDCEHGNHQHARSAEDVDDNNAISDNMNVVLRDTNGQTTNIGQMEVVRHKEGVVYNLKGEQTNKNKKGVYIVNGQKVVIK